jgi:hypothetical protein
LAGGTENESESVTWKQILQASVKDRLDEVEDVGTWLINEEEHPPEHYLAEEANLDPSRLRQ